MKRHHRDVIIGGGFAGLSMAARLEDPLILTKDIGGLIRTFKSGSFNFDLGGHVYTTGDERVYDIMLKSGAAYHGDRKAYYIDGPDAESSEWIEFPVQGHVPGAYDGMTVYERPSNMFEYASNVFSHGFMKWFFKPFNERVWTIPLEKMDYDWIEGRVMLPSEDKKKWGMNSSFYYAPGNHIIATLTKSLGQYEACDFNVQAIDPYDKLIIGEWMDSGVSDSIPFERVFVTTEMMTPGLRNRVCTVGIGLYKKLPYHFHWVYPHVSSDIHRVTLLSRYHEANSPIRDDSLLFEIPHRAGHRPLNQYARQLARAQSLHEQKHYAALIAADAGFTIMPDEIRAVFMRDFTAYPIPTVGSRNSVAAVKASYLPYDIYLLGRWGSHGYFNLQHILQDVDAVEAQMQTGELQREYAYSSFYYKGGSS